MILLFKRRVESYLPIYVLNTSARTPIHIVFCCATNLVKYLHEQWQHISSVTSAWQWDRKLSWRRRNLSRGHPPMHINMERSIFYCLQVCQDLWTASIEFSTHTVIPLLATVPTSLNMPSGCCVLRIRNLMASQMMFLCTGTRLWLLTMVNTLAT